MFFCIKLFCIFDVQSTEMKKLLFCCFLLSCVEHIAQVQIGDIELINGESPEAYVCYNNADAMSGTDDALRFFLYFNSDTIFLDVNASGLRTTKIAHLGANISLVTIAVKDDKIWLCWKEPPYIKAMYSTDEGDSWSSVINVSAIGGNSSAPSLAVSENGKAHVVWFNEDAGDTVIMHNVYSSGNFLATANEISTPGFKASWPAVTVYGDSVFCTWKEKHGDENYIYFSRSASGGANASWSAPVLVSGSTIGKDPNIVHAYDEGANQHYLYAVYDGNQKIYLQKSLDLGDNWTSPEIVSNTQKKSQFAKAVCNNSGFLGISWEHRTVVNLHDDTKKDVGFCYSTSWGNTGSFSHDSLAYTGNPFGSTLSQINKIDETHFYLVWKSNDTVNQKSMLYERSITLDDLGFTDIKSGDMKVYPNPASTFLILSGCEGEIRLTDLSGKTIFESLTKGKNTQINLDFVQPGAYILSSGEQRIKLIIE